MEIHKAIKVLSIASEPASTNLPNVLLVDANGDDEVTKRLYKAREELLYNAGEFCVNYISYIGWGT